jgi:hypothetical protein
MTHRPVALVLDNEAVQALADVGHPEHRRALAFVEVAQQRSRRGRERVALVVPVAVRIEAGWDRVAARAALINRLHIDDVELRGDRVDRAVRLARQAGVSVVDATVGEAALAIDGRVAIVTSDAGDMRRQARLADHEVTVVHL